MNQVLNVAAELILAPPVPVKARLERVVAFPFPARVTLRSRKLLSSIFKAVAVPVDPSIKIPCGQPIMIELKIEIAEFLLICDPQRNNELPILFNVARGPIAVILLKIAFVFGVAVVPLALLSLSNASEVEISAITESRSTRPNCTLPLNPLSVSKSSSCVLYVTRYFAFTDPP